MPNSIVAFECDVCHRVFTGSEAEKEASRCEKLGTPECAFEIGKTFFGDLFWKGRTLLKISEQRIEYNEALDMHIPMYKVILVNTEGEMEGWNSEGKIRRMIKETSQL